MDKKAFRTPRRWASWIPFGMAITVAVILLLEVRFLMDEARWIEHTDQVITLSQRMFRNRIDQESGLRAYVLTGDKRFLEPFYEARNRLLASEPELRKLVADNPEQTRRNEGSFAAFHSWSAWADQAIAMAKAGDDAGDVQFQLRGKELMDTYRRTREEFIQRERELREQRVRRTQRAFELVNVSIVALAIAFALAFAYFGRRHFMPDNSRIQPRFLRNQATQYVFAVVMLVVSTGVRSLLQPILGDRLPYPFFFVAVAIVSLLCDLYPALLVLVASAVIGDYFFLPPYHQFTMDTAGWITTIIYVVSGLVIIYTGQTHRRSGAALEAQKDWLHTTLTSIGDAVIATDADGRITLMNRVAENLTAWTLQQAQGKPLAEVFSIINQETRETVENPVDKVRRLNSVVGLANHTVLINKNGRELVIDDSGAPIFAADGSLTGVVLVFRDATEQRLLAAEAQSRAAETASQRERLAGIINSAMDAIITVDESQRIRVFNRAAEQIFRCPVSETIGLPLDKFIPERFHHPHRQHIEGFAQTGVTSRSMSRPGNLWARRRDGEEFPIEATISQVEAGGEKLFTVVLRDVTEKKEAETKLAEQAGLLELTSDAIIVRDDLGRIAYWNKGAEVIYGWTQAEAVGKFTHDLLRTKFPQPLPEILDRVRKEKHWQGELVHTRKDGEHVTVLTRWLRVRPDQGSNDARSLMEINTDITRHKQLEAALQSNERLALAGRLSASIAHEINNPIDAVSNALYLIHQRVDGEREVQTLISLAQTEAKRVAEITKNMLSLHRELRATTTVKLSQLLEGIVALIEETIAKGRRNIELVSDFAGEVEAFPSELRQVFINVLKNAVEATADDGEIRIYSEAAQESGEEGVLVRVVDNGIGVTEEVKEKLFSPFVTTKEGTGTGLGLWVSRSIVEKHGGSIRLSSGAGSGDPGTIVSIFLPLKIAARQTAESAISSF
jgi:PAS domain S-box-containing protein